MLYANTIALCKKLSVKSCFVQGEAEDNSHPAAPSDHAEEDDEGGDDESDIDVSDEGGEAPSGDQKSDVEEDWGLWD